MIYCKLKEDFVIFMKFILGYMMMKKDMKIGFLVLVILFIKIMKKFLKLVILEKVFLLKNILKII